MDVREVRNALLKGLVLFTGLILLFGWWQVNRPVSTRRQLSLYNLAFPGRPRLPFGEDSSSSYNLSLFDLNAMFSSHELSASTKPAGEFRVLVLGDSSIWGTLLRPEQTLSGQLNTLQLSVCGATARFYNLGYPTISVTKDLMLLDYARIYEADLVLWGVTLEALPADKQLSSPLVANNAARVQALIARYDLPLDPADPSLVRPGFWESTLLGQRRALADLVRLQLYGVLWAATGIDQSYPDDYTPALLDYPADQGFHGLLPPDLEPAGLAFEVLDAAAAAAGGAHVLVFNEPMLISSGENSSLRYNFFYPRWAYDQYRAWMSERARDAAWSYVDLWDLLPAGEFTNSAIHLTPEGEFQLAQALARQIGGMDCP